MKSNLKIFQALSFGLVIVFALVSSGYSQLFGQGKEKWIPEIKYDSGKLGFALQAPFYNICNACGITKKELQATKNYIPKDILEFLPAEMLKRTAVKTGDISGTSLFKAVFSASKINNSTSISSLTPDDFLPVSTFSETSTPYSVLVQDFSWFQYNRTCAGILSATVDADVSGIPVANLKASLNKEMKKEVSIAVYGGWFSSPYLRMLDDPKTSVKFYSALWDYYRTHSAIDGKLYLMKNFKGVLIGTTKESSDYSKFEQKMELNYATPFAAGQVQSRAALDISSGFKSVQWHPIVYDNFTNEERSKLFAELPTVKSTADFLTEVAKNPTLTSLDGRNFASGQEHSHLFLIEGFPVSLSGQQAWMIESSNFTSVYKGDIKLIVRSVDDRSGIHVGNEFTIKGTPKDELFSADPTKPIGSVNINYTLRTKDPIHGEYIRITVNSGIQSSAHPIPQLPDQISYDLKNIRQQSGNKMLVDIEWSKAINMTDTQNPISNTPGIKGELSKSATIKFSDGTTKPVDCSLILKDGTFMLTIIQKNAEFQNGINFSPNLPRIEVDFDTSIKIPLKNGQTSEKIFRTKLTYPVENKTAEVSPVAMVQAATGS